MKQFPHNVLGQQDLSQISTLDVLRTACHDHLLMIQGFRDKNTRLFAEGERVKQFQSFKNQAEKRLRILEAAEDVNDLMRISSNHFEALSGKRKGQYCIRINEQWRICFTWSQYAKGPENVEIVDYH